MSFMDDYLDRRDREPGFRALNEWLSDPDRSTRPSGPTTTYRPGSAWPVGVRPPMSRAMALRDEIGGCATTSSDGSPTAQPLPEQGPGTEQPGTEPPHGFHRRPPGRGRRVGG